MHGESFWSDPHAWVAIAFVIFWVLLGRKAWTAITGILDKRAATIRAELAEASRLRQEAEAMLRDATAQRADALANAHKLLEGAKLEAARLAAAAAAEAAHAATRREKMAMDRIAAAEKSAVDDVRTIAADVAATAAANVIRDSLTPAADGILIDRSIAGLPAALASKRAA
jgi:F-type H+-transporting ATPase subunit b